MYTICINGAPGSGKSLMGRELLKGENKEIVHLDYILERFRKVLPSNSVNVISRDNEGGYSQINRHSLVYKLIHLRYVYSVYKKIRDTYVKNELVRLKKVAEETGKEYFVVEGVDADEYNDIFNYDFKIYISSSEDERLTRVKNRDHIPGVMFDESFI